MKKTLQEIQREIEENRIRKINEERIRIQEENKRRDEARHKWVKMNEKFLNTIPSSQQSAGGHITLSEPESEITEFQVFIIDFVPNEFEQKFDITINVEGPLGPDYPEVIERGLVYGLNPDPSVEDNNIQTASDISGGLGEFTLSDIDIIPDFYFEEVFIRAFIVLSDDTVIHSPAGLSPSTSFTPQICLAEGTEIKLSNGTSKKIEDVQYTDDLLVWDFDLGIFSSSNPLWIKKKETTKKYNLLKFSDGSELKTINQHRIFNKESGKFTYPMSNDTPIGTTSFNMNGEEIILESKKVVESNVNYYNIITANHINVFANGILTSCRYNNIYPIKDMKFLKTNKSIKNREDYNISDKFYHGLRISEQDYTPMEVEKYVSRLISSEAISEIELV